ncbi:MAG: formate dehydrogenase accessory sulfurtransferase FdhD [Planctomycetota bacterium]
MTPSPPWPRLGTQSFKDASNQWDELIVVAPLMVEIGQSRLLNYRTPGEDEALVRGFLLTEGFITSPSEVASIEIRPSEDGPEIDAAKVTLRGQPARHPPLFREIRPSCGACGDDGVTRLRPLPLPVEPRSLTKEALVKAIHGLSIHQPLFKATGACHAAALTDLQGMILVSAEDVGRHNAVDKVIGKFLSLPLLGGGQGGGLQADLSKCILALSGRAGFELIAKAIRAGIPAVVSVSATTSLSLRTAKDNALTLAGFCRGNSVRVYHDPGRIRPSG